MTRLTLRGDWSPVDLQHLLADLAPLLGGIRPPVPLDGFRSGGMPLGHHAATRDGTTLEVTIGRTVEGRDSIHHQLLVLTTPTSGARIDHTSWFVRATDVVVEVDLPLEVAAVTLDRLLLQRADIEVTALPRPGAL
ncbi:MAG: hypothetical protein KC656_23200 [Myxococcales bacterium]|nr:hypothetical protein [Myxococcales bacterium]